MSSDTQKVELIRAYYQGVREGIEMFAHWREGVQYVGTTGKTLKEAIDKIKVEEMHAIQDFLRD
jgi:hypothetical protein